MSLSAASQKRPVVCVFCGSYTGTSPVHLEAARLLARSFHQHGVKLIYGGSTNGVMGELAKTLVLLSGKHFVHGIIPRPLLGFERDMDKIDTKTIINEDKFGLTTVVEDMHTRKNMMVREVLKGGVGSGFIALSGGYGTLDELMEITTWNQLGIHALPIVVYNVNGYFDKLMEWVREAGDAGFIKKSNVGIISVANTVDEVMDRIRDYQTVDGRANLRWGEQ